MDDLTANLFPHTYLGEEGAKRVLSLFDSITICVPWYGEPPRVSGRINGVSIKYPPESLHPGKGFLSLLSEYRNWINQHADKSTLDFLKASRDREADEETTWDIRRSLRRMGGEQETPPAENIPLRWHMILHLARELEEQREEADQVLKRLKHRKSPLEGVLDEDSELKSLFEDLPGFSEGPPAGSAEIAPILEAWLGLFGGNLGPRGFLVTVNPAVMEEVAELWEGEKDFQGPLGENMVTFQWPDLSSLHLGEISEARRAMLEDDRLKQIRTLLEAVDEDPRGALKRLQEEAHKLTLDEYPKAFRATLRYLDPDLVEGGPQEAGRFKPLGGKVLVLIRG
ncbi:MAG: hypothetical protein JRJ31_14825 [Deltaproteobacteria bacterium]|nr:hypothetical protein [Deltaproteobacteria bacterium]